MVLERLPRALFGLALFLGVFALGFASAEFGFWPKRPIVDTLATIDDLKRHWKNDFGIEPTRHLAAARHNGHGVTMAEPEWMQPGPTLVAGLFEGQIAARLLAPDGTVLHTWTVAYQEIWPERDEVGDNRPATDWNVFLHGILALPDGSIVFNFDTGGSLVRMDRCGGIIWKRPEPIHHSVFRAEDGTFWVPLLSDIAQVSADGELLQRIEIGQLFERSDLEGAAFIPAPTNPGDAHLNDVEVLPSTLAGAFPSFAPGDILVSLRNLNLVFVADPKTAEVKWFQHGPWIRQHDPDFLADGTISIFDNRMGHGASRIIKIDPVTRATTTTYRSDLGTPFYTSIRGKHQPLGNGNILITEAQSGRAFEVTGNGRLVWEFINRYDATRVAVISNAIRYDEDYFEVDDWSACGQKGALDAKEE